MIYGEELLQELLTQQADLQYELNKAENLTLGVLISETELEQEYDIPLTILELKLKILKNKGKAVFPSVVWADTQKPVEGIKYILNKQNKILFYDQESDSWILPNELPLNYDLALVAKNAWITQRNKQIEIIEVDSNYWTGEKDMAYIKLFEPNEYIELIKKDKLENGDFYELGDELKINFI